MTKYIFIILGFVSVAYGCASTGGGTVTTTAATTGCNSCTTEQVTLAAETPGDVNSHAPTVAMGAPQDGCITLIVTCTPIGANAESLLTFQNGLGGPAPGNPATATLVCNTQGQWIFTNIGPDVITEAYCLG